MNRPEYALKRNDIPGAVRVFGEYRARGAIPPEALEVLANLQDDPADFFSAIAPVVMNVEVVGSREDSR